MTIGRFWLLTALLAALVFPVVSLAEDPPAPWPLDFKPRKDAEARYGFSEVYSLANVGEALRNGRSGHQYMTDAQVRFKIVEVAEASVTVEMVYERVRFFAQSDIMKQPPGFDTAMPAEDAAQNPLAPAFLPLIEKPITLRLSRSGKIEKVETPTIEFPEVKFVGVAKQFVETQWLTERFQPAFSLSAPGPDVRAQVWTLGRELPAAIGVDRTLRVKTMNFFTGTKDGKAAVTLESKAELLPPAKEGAYKADLKSFAGTGNASWMVEDGMLGTLSTQWSWVLAAEARDHLPNRIEVGLQSMLSRLK